MFDFLKKILGRKTKPTKPVKDARLGVEELMQCNRAGPGRRTANCSG